MRRARRVPTGDRARLSDVNKHSVRATLRSAIIQDDDNLPGARAQTPGRKVEVPLATGVSQHVIGDAWIGRLRGDYRAAATIR